MSINPTLGHYKLASTIVEKAQEMRKITNKLVPNKKIKHVEPWTDDNSAENSRDEVEANASKIIANEVNPGFYRFAATSIRYLLSRPFQPISNFIFCYFVIKCPCPCHSGSQL